MAEDSETDRDYRECLPDVLAQEVNNSPEVNFRVSSLFLERALAVLAF